LNAHDTLTACIFIDLDGFTGISARTDARCKLFILFSMFFQVYGSWSSFGQVFRNRNPIQLKRLNKEQNSLLTTMPMKISLSPDASA
jgi:hypothetical protein